MRGQSSQHDKKTYYPKITHFYAVIHSSSCTAEPPLIYFNCVSTESTAEGEKEPPADPSPKKKKKVMGPSLVGPPTQHSICTCIIQTSVGVQFKVISFCLFP